MFVAVIRMALQKASIERSLHETIKPRTGDGEPCDAILVFLFVVESVTQIMQRLRYMDGIGF